MARRNPFRTEAEAFRLLLVTIAAFAAIAVASLVGGWKLGVPVWIVVTVAAIWYYLRPLPEETRAQAPARVRDGDEWRLLVVANETVAGRELRDAVGAAVTGHRAQVLVVCPALNSKLRHWASDEDGARVAAQARLGESLARLAESGVDCAGEGRRLGSAASDRGRVTDVRRRRDHHLDAPRGPVELARARRGRVGAPALRRSDRARRRRPRRLERRGPPKRPSIGWQRMRKLDDGRAARLRCLGGRSAHTHGVVVARPTMRQADRDGTAGVGSVE